MAGRRLRDRLAVPRPPRPACAGQRLAGLAHPRRTRRGQDSRRCRMGARGCHRRAGTGGADRACRRNLRRHPRGDDRGRVGPARYSSVVEPAGMAALAPPARLAEWNGGASLLGRRSGEPARTAILRRLGGRTRQMALSRRRLGHAAIRPQARTASAPGGDHDAAADPAAQAADRGGKRTARRWSVVRPRRTTP